MSQSIIAPRPDYWSGAFEFIGLMPKPVPKTFGDLRITPGLELRPVNRDRWQELLATDHRTGHKVSHPLAYVSFNDEDTEVVGRMNEALGRPRLTAASAQELCLDKGKLYAHFDSSGLPTPSFTVVENLDEFDAAMATRQSRDQIIKPTRGSGSRGVLRVGTGVGRAQEIARRTARGMMARSGEPLVVMDAVDSSNHNLSEWSVEGVVFEDRVVFSQVFEKTTQVHTPPLQDLRMVSPANGQHRSEMAEVVRNSAALAVSSLKLGTSVFHVELRTRDDGATYPIDVGLRPGGGLICEGVLMTHGLDLRVIHALVQIGDEQIVNDYLAQNLHECDGGVALGACYWDRRRTFNSSSPQLIVEQLLAEQRDGDIEYNMLCELSSSDLIAPDAGLSLCVHGRSSDLALSRLERIARTLNFR